MAKGPEDKPKVPLIGILAVKNQLVTHAELEVGLAQCRDADNLEKALKGYLISQELISQKNMTRLELAAKAITIRQKEYRFGAIALAKGFINKSVLELVLEEQEADIKTRTKPRLIGDLLVEAGLITQRQKDYILKLQKRVNKSALKITKPDTADEKQPGPDQGETPENGFTEKAPKKEAELLPPEMISGGVQLQVSGDYMGAFLSKSDAFDEDVLVSDIKDDLFERGIVSGVMGDEMIEGFIKSSGFKIKAFRVAKGIAPVQGQDAKIEFFFNTDYLKAGGMDEDGNIDFKDRGEVPLVEKGTVLAEKTPRVEGRWGQSIYGDEMAAEKGEDKALRFGKGAVLSEDGLKVLADVRGYPKYALSGIIFVHEEYTTGGDVDFETGHIEFDGNVNVKGCIKSGFKVKGCDVTSVELDGGIVEADGDLKVAGGIIEGKIYARGNVYAKFVQSSEIVCMGDVIVEKEIVESDISASGTCVIVNGTLIHSTVRAKMGLTARNVGTELASPSVITVGHDVFTEKELKINKAKAAGIKEKILGQEGKKEELKALNGELQKKITELAHVQDRSQLEQREIERKMADPEHASEKNELAKGIETLKAGALDAEKELDVCFEKTESLEGDIRRIDRGLKGLKAQLEEVIAERNNLTRWSKENPGKAVVAVEGAILSGTHIKGKHSELKVDTVLRRSRITEILHKAEGGEEGGRNVYQMKVGNF